MFGMINNIGNKFSDSLNFLKKNSVYPVNNIRHDPQFVDNALIKQDNQPIRKTFKSYYA